MAKTVTTIRNIYLLCCSLILMGCGDVPPADEVFYQNYIRLNRLLGNDTRDLKLPLVAAIPPLPSATDKFPAIPELRYSITEIWQYRACGLAQRMGERNSILGKVMPASQQLIYETQLLVTLAICLKQHNNEQFTWLKALTQAKQQQLPDRWQTFLWSDSIIRGLFKPPNKRAIPRRGRTRVIEGLSQLNKQRYQTVTLGEPLDQSFELMLYKLEGNHYLGQLAIDSENALAWLTKTNALLVEGLPQITCIDNRPSPEAKRLRGYLLDYHAKHMLPTLTQLLRELREVKLLLQPLYGDTEQNNTIGFLASNHGYYQNIKHAVQRDQQTWQTFFNRCGLSLQP